MCNKSKFYKKESYNNSNSNLYKIIRYEISIYNIMLLKADSISKHKISDSFVKNLVFSISMKSYTKSRFANDF